MGSSTGAFIVVLLIVGLLIYTLIGFVRELFNPKAHISDTAPMICPNCGTRGTPRISTRGSILIELILWLCFLIPGLIYSFWRLSGKREVCPACGETGMISVTTPMGRMFAEKYHNKPEEERT